MVASQYSKNKGGDHIWGGILKLWGPNTYRGLNLFCHRVKQELNTYRRREISRSNETEIESDLRLSLQ